MYFISDNQLVRKLITTIRLGSYSFPHDCAWVKDFRARQLRYVGAMCVFGLNVFGVFLPSKCVQSNAELILKASQ
jgi:hypothetical protein